MYSKEDIESLIKEKITTEEAKEYGYDWEGMIPYDLSDAERILQSEKYAVLCYMMMVLRVLLMEWQL